MDDGKDYAGQSSVVRRARRRAALVDATLTELARLGPSHLSARHIYQRAKLNPRYFKEAFSSVSEAIDAAFDAVAEGIIEAIHHAFGEIPDDAPFAEKVRVGYSAAFGYIDDDPRRLALAQHSNATAALRARRQNLVDQLASEMIHNSPSDTSTDKEGRILWMVAIALADGTIELYLRHRSGQLAGVSNEQLEDTLVNLVLRVSSSSSGSPT